MYYRHTVDYYKIVLEQDTVISVSLKHKGDEDSWGKTCIRFYFYMPDDLKTPYYKYGLAGAETHEISDLGLPAGTYYIKIEEEYDSDDDYEIRVDGKKNPAWESELNDTHETAENIKTGKRYYGSVITSSDLDFYKFEVKKDGYITINMKHNFPIHFQVRDGQANMYYEKLISETGKDFTTSKIELKKGTYYLGLCAATMYSKGTYSFLIKEKAVSQKAPTIVKAESLQYNRIQLTWKKTDGAERYEIYRSTSKNGTYKKVYTTKNGTTTVWTDKNVKTGKTTITR